LHIVVGLLGGCSSLESIDVDEDADSVQIRVIQVTAQPTDAVCTDVMQLVRSTVQLDDPVRSRQIIGDCAGAEPPMQGCPA